MIRAIRKMSGGSQSQLMLGSDHQLWVVKFQNNPQHVRVLANEMIATRLARAIGLPVPACDVVEVSAWLVEHTPDLFFERSHGRPRQSYLPGRQFGSKFVGMQPECNSPGEQHGSAPRTVVQTVDYLPTEKLLQVQNLSDFAGVLCLDKWTNNCDSRQAIFSRGHGDLRYVATFIDQGYCLNAGDWKFADSPLRGAYLRTEVYESVCGWESFEPWLSRIEGFQEELIRETVHAVPREWCVSDDGEIERLVKQLFSRRERVRELIAAFRDTDRLPFPLWGKSS